MDDKTIWDFRSRRGVYIHTYDPKIHCRDGNSASIVCEKIQGGSRGIVVFVRTAQLLEQFNAPGGSAKTIQFEDGRQCTVTVYKDGVSNGFEAIQDADCVIVHCRSAGLTDMRPAQDVVDLLRTWITVQGRSLHLVISEERNDRLLRVPPVSRTETTETIVLNEKLWAASEVGRRMLENEREEELNRVAIAKLLSEDAKRKSMFDSNTYPYT